MVKALTQIDEVTNFVDEHKNLVDESDVIDSESADMETLILELNDQKVCTSSSHLIIVE